MNGASFFLWKMFWESNNGLMAVHLFSYTGRRMNQLMMDGFPCHDFFNDLLMTRSMDIVIVFGSDDGCLSTLIISIEMESISC